MLEDDDDDADVATKLPDIVTWFDVEEGWPPSEDGRRTLDAVPELDTVELLEVDEPKDGGSLEGVEGIDDAACVGGS